MKRIFPIIRKEIIQLRRNPILFRILFIAPVIQMLLLGYAATLDIKDIQTAVCDLDHSHLSRELISELANSGYLDIPYVVTDIRTINELMDKGEVSVAVIIPPTFSEDIVGGQTAAIGAVFDGTNSNAATIAMGYLATTFQRKALTLSLQRLSRLGSASNKISLIHPQIRVWYNQEMKSNVFMVPGVIAMVLMVMTMLLTSMVVVREREIGTIEQLLTTPIRPWELIFGKTIPFVIIGLIDVGLVVLVGRFWFRVPTVGSIPLLFSLSLLFILTTLGAGLFFSTISRTQQQAMMTSYFFILPNMVLSGFIYPIENMPTIIQYLTFLWPLRYFLVIVRGILLKGVGLSVLWPQALSLLLFGAAVFSFSVIRFQKRLT